MYRKTTNEEGQVRTDQVQKIEDGLLIPFDKANTDYQEYLKWTKANPMNVAEENE